MTSKNDDFRDRRKMTRAEIYGIALRRLATMKESKKDLLVAIGASDVEFPNGRALQRERYEPIVAPVKNQAGWRKLILPRDGTMTLSDMQTVFAMAFTAAGSPAGAAMYSGKKSEVDWTLYFSPAALAIFGSVMMLKGAIACERPSSSDVTLLCGDSVDGSMLSVEA